MSIETRSNSALFKRAEQLKRWEKSETNLEPTTPSTRERKIKFSPGCVFLAACKAGDKEEILRLLRKGADIDTSDVDGLSALHQACIDDNLDLVEFLVKHGADVNKGDNEGWTPLHATSSCGFISIAKFLIENGADVAAVNNDGELPMDVAESNAMEDMLQKLIEDKGIDAENARTEEERLMLNDAKDWLANGSIEEKVHPKTGATALHVAAAKGYLKVMDLLIKAGADVDVQDLDGWTALHAGAHWCQKEACQLLVENLCDMDIKNCVGQTPFDVADNEMLEFLEDLRKKQAVIPNKDNVINRRKNNQKRVTPQGALLDNSEPKKNMINDVAPSQPKVPEVQQVELQIKPEPTQNQSNIDTDEDIDTLSSETSGTETSDVSDDESDVSDEDTDLDKKYRVNERLPSTTEVNKIVPNTPAPSISPKTPSGEGDDSGVPAWRRPGSFRTRLAESSKSSALKINEKETPSKVPAPPAGTPAKNETSQEVRLRRTQSFEADEKFYQRYLELRAKIASNCYPSASSTPMRSASLKEKHFTSVFERRAAAAQAREDEKSKAAGLAATASTPSSGTVTSSVANSSPTSTSPQNNLVRSSAPVTPSTPTTPGGSKLSPANIFKNFFKSFVPPVRDEESETQRKAHAKRVRETRRSTQGVTLEEIKSAEQLNKKKQQQQLQEVTQQLTNSEPRDDVVVVNVRAVPVAPPSPTLTSSTTASTVNSSVASAEPSIDREQQENGTLERTSGGGSLSERRPSWRLKVDNSNKFMLEDARKNEGSTVSPVETVVRKTAIATPVTETGDTTVTLPLRKRVEDKEQEKDSDSRTAQATQAAIQRRRRPKRRSTGVVHVDMDEIDPERQGDSSGGGGSGDTDDSLSINNSESGGELSDLSSRLNSVSTDDPKPEATENGEIDYKKLYEESQRDNERLREKLRIAEVDLAEAKALADSNPSQTRNSLTEMEKRERRALERKLSEMEEELKQLDQLKCENQRLKDENGALIRVISKLSK